METYQSIYSANHLTGRHDMNHHHERVTVIILIKDINRVILAQLIDLDQRGALLFYY